MPHTYPDVIDDPTEATNPDQPPTQEESDAWERDLAFARPERTDAGAYPRMWNMSAGFWKPAIARPLTPEPSEYLAIPIPMERNADGDERLRRRLAVHQWNSLWEAGQFRRRFFDENDLTSDLAAIAARGDINVTFVPRTESRFYEYAPLYHLLTADTCRRFGLPLLASGQWPFGMDVVDIDRFVPADFEHRLSRAWAHTVWSRLNSGSPQSAFKNNDSIRILAHNLDYWLPPVTQVIEETLRGFPVVKGDRELPTAVRLEDGSVLGSVVAGWPRMGGDVWCGAAEAADVVTATVDAADQTGQLRGILDAIRSNRVEDDFSPRWSNARIDFERKLYRTRNKIKVRFVELPDNLVVQGPDTEVEGSLICNDFLALLDTTERQIVILLASGHTKLTDIADQLGYANHSPISKKLARIRARASEYFVD